MSRRDVKLLTRILDLNIKFICIRCLPRPGQWAQKMSTQDEINGISIFANIFKVPTDIKRLPLIVEYWGGLGEATNQLVTVMRLLSAFVKGHSRCPLPVRSISRFQATWMTR